MANQTFVISRYEAQNVLVTQHHCLVDLGLAEPRAFLPGGEYLNGDVLASPAAAPDLSKATLADYVHQLDLAGYGPLH